MSKKTLNKANLEKLGARTLADLVMDLVQGAAALQRRARTELSAAQGPKEVTADLRKRFASLRRSRSYVDWRKQRALVKVLVTFDKRNTASMSNSQRFTNKLQRVGDDLMWTRMGLASA